MNKNQYKTAIYFSDIVGYSKMIGDNEELALSLLREHDAISIESIKKYNGTIIKHIGDAIFAKFNLIDEAINASTEIQRNLSHRSQTQKKEKHIQIRIGLHEGNVVEKDNDLFGHNVNLCSRIEGSAIPGSIAISKEALDNSQLDNIKRFYGHVKLKNIKEPTKLFRIYHSKEDYLSENSSDFMKLISDRGIQMVDIDSFSIDDTTSLAFLYPQNLGDVEDEFFCYSFLEQIIGDLQKCNDLRVPNIFDIQKYKQSSLPPNSIGRELGVDNIIESSIMKIGNQFKITIQLTSLDNGEVILQKSWKNPINNFKNVAGKMTLRVLDQFKISTEGILAENLNRDLNIEKEAYELFLKGSYLCNHVKAKEDYMEAQKILEEAINKDDNFSEAHAFNGIASMRIGHFEEAEESFDIALEIAEETNNLDSLSTIYNFLGIYHKNRGHLRKAIRNFEKGLKIHKESNNKIKECHILNNLADCYSKTKKNEQAIEFIERIIPEYKKREEFEYLANSYGNLGNAYKNMGQLTNALEYYNKSSALCVKTELHLSQAQNLIIISDIYNQMGLIDESKKNLSKLDNIANTLKNELIYGRYKAALSRMHLNSKDLNNGNKYIKESIKHCQNVNNNALVVRYLLDLSFIMIRNNDFNESESKLNQAITLLENKYRNPKLEFLAECYQCLINIKRDESDNMIKNLLDKIQDEDIESFKIISLCYKESGDLNNFKKYSKKWNDVILSNSENISDEKQKNSFLNLNLLN